MPMQVTHQARPSMGVPLQCPRALSRLHSLLPMPFKQHSVRCEHHRPSGAWVSGSPASSAHSSRLVVRSNRDSYTQLLGPNFSNRSQLSEDMIESVMQLPGTKGLIELRERAEALGTWKTALARGTLPEAEAVAWPQEPFRSRFLEALKNLEMARFTRRYPAILNTLLRQMLELVSDFEQKLLEAEAKRQAAGPKPSSSPMPQQQQQAQQGQGSSGAGGGESEQDDQEQQMSQEQMEEAMQNAMSNPQGQGNGKQLQVELHDIQGGEMKQDEQAQQEADAQLKAEIEEAAENIVGKFEQDMGEVVQNLERAEKAFDDLSELVDGPEGFDLSKGAWRRNGWRELDDLRRKLENLKELRELVRSLGRGGGKGPLRRAPEELEAPRQPPGVIRSPLQPEEVRGLTRSGELSRMLPSEIALLAHGWPRKGSRDSSDSDDGENSEIFEYYLPGAHAARMLHRVRRAERMLLSYDRTGWLEDIPARVTDRMEIRPAAELGPIILCLDTSGSMRGARETVAKALTLECMRGAHRQRRKCFVYAFSGPGEVQELELGVDAGSLTKLLDFLSCSFMGGTDVDQPLALSLDRLAKAEWSQADILMVTDGEISPPDKKILDRIAVAERDMGLEVHGLLVASDVTEAMKSLCTHLHVFKSWTAVGGDKWQY